MSKRTEINRGEGLEIIIKSYYDESKQTMLTLWLILWSVAGLGILSQFFYPAAAGMTSYLVVWIAFWAYFEYKVLYAYRWRRYGLERIEIKDGKLHLTREVAGRGIPQVYDIEWIKNLRLHELKKSNFFIAMSQAYWSPGDEHIQFEYKGKDIFFGLELEDREAKKVLDELKKEFKVSV